MPGTLISNRQGIKLDKPKSNAYIVVYYYTKFGNSNHNFIKNDVITEGGLRYRLSLGIIVKKRIMIYLFLNYWSTTSIIFWILVNLDKILFS